MIDYGKAKTDGEHDKEKAKPRNKLFRFRKARKQQQKQWKEDIEPPLHWQRPRLPIEIPERSGQVLRESGKTPNGESLGVARNDLIMYQKIIDRQDEKVVGQDAQGRSGIKSKDLLPTEAVFVPFEVQKERLANEITTHDEEDVDAMRHRKVGEAVEGSVVKQTLAMPLHDAKNGKSPQQVQTEDSFRVNLDAQEIPHLTSPIEPQKSCPKLGSPTKRHPKKNEKTSRLFPLG